MQCACTEALLPVVTPSGNRTGNYFEVANKQTRIIRLCAIPLLHASGCNAFSLFMTGKPQFWLPAKEGVTFLAGCSMTTSHKYRYGTLYSESHLSTNDPSWFLWYLLTTDDQHRCTGISMFDYLELIARVTLHSCLDTYQVSFHGMETVIACDR